MLHQLMFSISWLCTRTLYLSPSSLIHAKQQTQNLFGRLYTFFFITITFTVVRAFMSEQNRKPTRGLEELGGARHLGESDSNGGEKFRLQLLDRKTTSNEIDGKMNVSIVPLSRELEVLIKPVKKLCKRNSVCFTEWNVMSKRSRSLGHRFHMLTGNIIIPFLNDILRIAKTDDPSPVKHHTIGYTRQLTKSSLVATQRTKMIKAWLPSHIYRDDYTWGRHVNTKLLHM